jgi:hypothetical protein
MNRLLVVVALILLVTAGDSAKACSITPPSARSLYGVADVVALARPLLISQRKVQRKGKEVSQQTIVWRALMVWKGPIKHGDQFVTRMYYGGAECTSRSPVRERTAQFFYGYGNSPFLSFDVNTDLPHAEDDFLFLSDIQSK